MSHPGSERAGLVISYIINDATERSDMSCHGSDSSHIKAAAPPLVDLSAKSDKTDTNGDREVSGDEEVNVAQGGSNETMKKKKRKPKKKAKKATALGDIPIEILPPLPETPEIQAYWQGLLVKGAKTHRILSWGLLEPRYTPILDVFRTPSCRNLGLRTPRFLLRQVEPGDTRGIQRIKTEPIVQETQLYGSPSATAVKESFQTRYIRSSIARATSTPCRDEFIFAVTAIDPSSITIQPPGSIRITNRLSKAEGYLGNIALKLETTLPTQNHFPIEGKTWRQPTFAQNDEADLIGRTFYELHPQLWGQGIMSEVFAEVLCFAMEEVGCTRVIADPTTNNPASVKLCERQGMRHTYTSADNEYKKPQMFHEITRDEWWARNRPGRTVADHWGGKEVCRWCMNFRLASPTVLCGGCDWAKYCSRECQRADWSLAGGHQDECDTH